MWLYFWTLYILSVYMPIPHSLDYCRFLIHLEIRYCGFSNFALLLKDYFGHSSPLHFYMDFRINLSYSTKSLWDFDWDCVESVDHIGEKRNWHPTNIELFNYWTWYIFSFCFLSFSPQQYCIIFNMEVWHISIQTYSCILISL